MKFQLDIELSDFNTEKNLVKVLQDLAYKIERGRITILTEDGSYPSGAVRDIFGTKVGDWQVVEDHVELAPNADEDTGEDEDAPATVRNLEMPLQEEPEEIDHIQREKDYLGIGR